MFSRNNKFKKSKKNSRKSTKLRRRSKCLNKSKKFSKYNKKNLIGGSSNSKKKQCPPNMKPSKLPNGDILCIGRCPHSGGIVTYKPKLDKLVCNLHGAQFEKSGKVIQGSGPATSNVKVVKLKSNEYFDERYIYEEVNLEPIEYAGLVGEQADWKIYKITPNVGTSAKVRHSISFKTSDLNEAGFEDVSDDQGVNNPLLIPYMLDIMRKQSIEVKNIQESLGNIQAELYDLDKLVRSDS